MHVILQLCSYLRVWGLLGLFRWLLLLPKSIARPLVSTGKDEWDKIEKLFLILWHIP